MHLPASALRLKRQILSVVGLLQFVINGHVTQFSPISQKQKSTGKVFAFLIKGTDILYFFFYLVGIKIPPPHTPTFNWAKHDLFSLCDYVFVAFLVRLQEGLKINVCVQPTMFNWSPVYCPYI